MKRLPVHQALSSLSWLEGKWQIQKYGCGQYPTIEDFKYCEEISFTSIGQPMFNYLAQSWHMENKIPLHRETGFLKVIPCTNKLSFILAHNSGLTTIEEGEVIDQTIKLNSVSIQRAQRLELPVVTRTRRQYRLNGDCLEYILYMATSNTPNLVEHLWTKFVKVCT